MFPNRTHLSLISTRRVKINIRELEATFHSTIFDIPMCPVHEDQRHRHRFTRPEEDRNSRDGNYSFEFCPLHAAHKQKSLSEKCLYEITTGTATATSTGG